MRDLIVRIFICWLALAAEPALSGEMPEGMVAVRYGFEVDGWKPVTGESFCHVDRDCQLGFDFDPLKIILRLDYSKDGTIAISCGRSFDPCPLARTWTRRFSVDEKLTFPIYRNYRDELTTKPLEHYSEQIGVLLLQYFLPHRPEPRAVKPTPVSFH